MVSLADVCRQSGYIHQEQFVTSFPWYAAAVFRFIDWGLVKSSTEKQDINHMIIVELTLVSSKQQSTDVWYSHSLIK